MRQVQNKVQNQKFPMSTEADNTKLILTGDIVQQ